MSKITFLDCTLRDGGYYNKWDFNFKKAEQLLAALNDSGVDIIEVGYKSKYDSNEFFGLFKYCNEEYLDFLSKDDSADYAFMIDVKEFIEDGKVDYKALDEVIKPAADSIFTWVRLASHYATIDSIVDLTAYFKDKGYIVGFNLMGGSLLTRDQMLDGTKVAKEADVKVFYLADSFGSFYPEDIRSLVRFLKDNYDGTLGIHTHDNQGMAYANTMAAIEEGVEFIDATVTGMGRGAGNLHTEQFLMGYSKRMGDDSYNASALMPIIGDYIEPLKSHYKWGYNITYMYSGLLNIHPTYCQKLSEGKQFNQKEQALILGNIPKESRSKFNKTVLEKAMGDLLQTEILPKQDGDLEMFDLTKLNTESCIIYARGPEGVNNIESIKKLMERNIPLIECNETGSFSKDVERYVIILNHVRTKELMLNRELDSKAHVVMGMADSIEDIAENISYYPFSIGEFNVGNEDLSIPDFDAGLYAIALAIKSGVKNIYLAGFDGYENEELNMSKEALFSQITKKTDVNIKFITPTRYKTFANSSLYTL